MGEIAEMMLDGTLCEGCGAYLDGVGGSYGVPRYCSRECARDRGALDLTLTRKQKADRPVDRGERVKFLPLASGRQAHKPWLCCDCGRRARLESGARQHWRGNHGRLAAGKVTL